MEILNNNDYCIKNCIWIKISFHVQITDERFLGNRRKRVRIQKKVNEMSNRVRVREEINLLTLFTGPVRESGWVLVGTRHNLSD